MKQNKTNGTSLLISCLALLVAANVGVMPVMSFASGGSGSGGGGGTTTAISTYINDFKVTSGYTPSSNSSLGAVWVQWKLNSVASPSGKGISILVQLTEKATGVLLYSVPGMYAQQTIDFDNMKTGTAYHVDFIISDFGTGLVLESRSADVTTPSHNATGI
ncbi:MAG: hypothetical protein HY043_03635 [Verrucomicrobia bacterium]|nr:hypothetical protein [Verrucomicrobiota bacterium]